MFKRLLLAAYLAAASVVPAIALASAPPMADPAAAGSAAPAEPAPAAEPAASSAIAPDVTEPGSAAPAPTMASGTGAPAAETAALESANRSRPAFPADPLCGDWKFTGSKEFEVLYPPEENQAADRLKLTCDKRIEWVMNGETRTGTWKTDAKRTMVIISVDGSKQKMWMRMLKVESGRLVLEYQDPDLVRHQLNFAAAN